MKFETASPEMLILMLYDGAVKNILQAQGIIYDSTQIDKCSNFLIKAQNIITELMVSLNFDIGGDIAKNLFNIYEYINYTLAQANINKNDENLDTIVQMLKDLRSTWQEVIRINKEKYPDGIPEAEVSMKQGTPNPAAPTAAAPGAPVASTPSGTAAAPPQGEGTLGELGSKPPPTPAQGGRFKQIYGKKVPRKV